MRKIYGTRKTKDFSYLYLRNENIKKMASCTAFTTKKINQFNKKIFEKSEQQRSNYNTTLN